LVTNKELERALALENKGNKEIKEPPATSAQGRAERRALVQNDGRANGLSWEKLYPLKEGWNGTGNASAI
jgi:hypothetical protein